MRKIHGKLADGASQTPHHDSTEFDQISAIVKNTTHSLPVVLSTESPGLRTFLSSVAPTADLHFVVCGAKVK